MCQDLSSVRFDTLWTAPIILRTNQTPPLHDNQQPELGLSSKYRRGIYTYLEKSVDLCFAGRKSIVRRRCVGRIMYSRLVPLLMILTTNLLNLEGLVRSVHVRDINNCCCSSSTTKVWIEQRLDVHAHLLDLRINRTLDLTVAFPSDSERHLAL